MSRTAASWVTSSASKVKYTGVLAETSLTENEPQVWCVIGALFERTASRMAAYCEKLSLARMPTAFRSLIIASV